MAVCLLSSRFPLCTGSASASDQAEPCQTTLDHVLGQLGQTAFLFLIVGPEPICVIFEDLGPNLHFGADLDFQDEARDWPRGPGPAYAVTPLKKRKRFLYGDKNIISRRAGPGPPGQSITWCLSSTSHSWRPRQWLTWLERSNLACGGCDSSWIGLDVW